MEKNSYTEVNHLLTTTINKNDILIQKKKIFRVFFPNFALIKKSGVGALYTDSLRTNVGAPTHSYLKTHYTITSLSVITDITYQVLLADAS